MRISSPCERGENDFTEVYFACSDLKLSSRFLA